MVSALASGRHRMVGLMSLEKCPFPFDPFDPFNLYFHLLMSARAAVAVVAKGAPIEALTILEIRIERIERRKQKPRRIGEARFLQVGLSRNPAVSCQVAFRAPRRQSRLGDAKRPTGV